MSAARLVLGIETSCDDTSVAVLEDGRTLRAHLIAAQDVHRLYGGVVPELASRAHLELLPRLVARALVGGAASAAGELTAIAVTRAPGLVGSLVVGVAFARAYGAALGIPVVGVNHIEAHLHAATLEHGASPLPAVALVVSGGHTELVEVRGFGRYRWLGSTRDDAAGEAYDKVAKLLGLGFPGGPVLDRLAGRGNRAAFAFPRPMLDRADLDFSFSGLKTAVALAVGRLGPPPHAEPLLADLAASFQAAVMDTLVGKTLRAVDQVGARALERGRRRGGEPRAARAPGGGLRAAGDPAARALVAALRGQRGDDRARRLADAGAGRPAGRGPRRGGLARGVGAADGW